MELERQIADVLSKRGLHKLAIEDEPAELLRLKIDALVKSDIHKLKYGEYYFIFIDKGIPKMLGMIRDDAAFYARSWSNATEAIEAFKAMELKAEDNSPVPESKVAMAMEGPGLAEEDCNCD